MKKKKENKTRQPFPIPNILSKIPNKKSMLDSNIPNFKSKLDFNIPKYTENSFEYFDLDRDRRKENKNNIEKYIKGLKCNKKILAINVRQFYKEIHNNDEPNLDFLKSSVDAIFYYRTNRSSLTMPMMMRSTVRQFVEKYNSKNPYIRTKL